jgi:hypothetical protein
MIDRPLKSGHNEEENKFEVFRQIREVEGKGKPRTIYAEEKIE